MKSEKPLKLFCGLCAGVAAASLTATALAEPATRYWADTNGATASFGDAASWAPAPDSIADVAEDLLVLNKGVDKIAELGQGESVSAANLTIGWGMLDGGATMAAANDLGGRLDVKGGTLNIASTIWVGNSYSDDHSTYLNATDGAKVYAAHLNTGECASNNGKSNNITLSGEGTELNVANDALLSTYRLGTTHMSITDGAKYVGGGNMSVGRSGTADLTVDGGTLEMTGKDLNVSGGGTGTVNFRSGRASFNTLNITQSGGTGTVNIEEGCTVDMGWAVFMGANATLNINGGMLDTGISINMANRDGGSSVINLNGGVLKTAEIAAGNANGVLNWNGGTLTREPHQWVGGNDVIPLEGGNPKTPSPISVRIGKNGAIYESLQDTSDDAISQHMAGAGAFTKRGGGTLTLKGALDIKGGYIVEGGKLVIAGSASGEAMTVKRVVVAEGATLDLGGSDIWTYEYVPGGTVENGTVNIISAEDAEPATAEWTNASGDRDATNPVNWIVKDAKGRELLDTALTADTVARIPATLAQPTNMQELTVAKAVMYLDAGEKYLRGHVIIPEELLAEAVAWYDPDERATLTVEEDGRVSAIRNKGVAGDALDLVAYDAESLPTLDQNNKLQTRQPLVHRNDTKGFVSKELYDFGASGQTLFCVTERCPDAGSAQVFGIELQSGDNWDYSGLVGIAQWPWFDGRLMVASVKDDEETIGVMADMENTENKPYVWGLVARPTTASGFCASADGSGSMVVKNSAGLEYDRMGVSKAEGGKRKIFYGMRKEDPAGSSGLVGEAIVFSRPLEDTEVEKVRDYLYSKWFNPGDVSGVPANLEVAAGATLDFGGGRWTFDTIKGAGAIGTADVTVTGSIDAGVTVGGKLTFGEGARIDISALDAEPVGREVVILTAKEFVNAPAVAMSVKRRASLKTVSNDDGTVSLVGKLDSRGMRLFLR